MQSTSERISGVATEILTRDGAEAVSMRRVAAAVGVTPMAIYRHFPNREALLDRVAEAGFASIVTRWQERPRAADPVAELHALLDDHLDFALREPRLYRYLFTERRADARQFPDDFRAGRSPTLNLVATAIEAGVRAGVLADDDVWESAITAAALTHGLILLFQGGRIALSEDAFRRLCHDSVRRLVDGLHR